MGEKAFWADGPACATGQRRTPGIRVQLERQASVERQAGDSGDCSREVCSVRKWGSELQVREEFACGMRVPGRAGP